MIQCYAPGITAQHMLDYSFRQIKQSDGLLHSQVLSIAQDAKGFIWIAGSNGLQRYDGERFIYYPGILSDPKEGITYGAEMYADKKTNTLWISNNDKFERLNLATKSFTVFDPDSIVPDSNFHFTAYKGSNKKSWKLGDHGLLIYDSITKKQIVSRLNILPANSDRNSYICTDSSQQITWVSLNRLMLFDHKTKQVYSDTFNPNHHPLLEHLFGEGEKMARFVMIDSKQNTWVTTWGNTFYRYNTKAGTLHRYSLADIRSTQPALHATVAGLLITNLFEDNHHVLWITTENAGLLRYNDSLDVFDHAVSQQNKTGSIQYNYKINSIFQDQQENIWVGTDLGISIFNPYRQYFTTIRHEQSNAASLPSTEINCVMEASTGDVFIGTWGAGVFIYDSNLHFKKQLITRGPDKKDFTWSLVETDDHVLWVGCQHGYIVQYDLHTGDTKLIRPEALENSTVRCMKKDQQGNIWLALHNGRIAEWEKQTNRFIAGKSEAAPAGMIINMMIDNRQKCWVSTTNGFRQFDLTTSSFTHAWLPEKNNDQSFSGKTSQGIESYNDSMLVIGSIYGGLNFFNTHTGKFSQLKNGDEPFAGSVFAVKKDTAGHLWFTTDYGLCKYDPSSKKTVTYNVGDGVLNAAFTAYDFYPLKNGYWLSFSPTEVISFSPAKLSATDVYEPTVEVTGFKIFDKTMAIDSFLANRIPLKLSYKENFITVEFASLSFFNLQQTNYYYRLTGVDKDWVHGGTKRFANYTDLQPGEYVFEVRAESGNNNGGITRFTIRIMPPFWKTGWFILLCMIALLLLLYGLIKWRIDTVRKDEKMKLMFSKQIADMEMKALRSQMNPHFIFNCINSIDALIQSNDKYQATVYLNKFAKLIRNILDSSKQNTVLLSKDIDTLQLYIELEQLRHENKFTSTITVEDNLLQDDYKVPPLIVQPFVENAILHGIRYRSDNNGQLTVSIKRSGAYLEYTITDNGVGRSFAGNYSQKEKVSYGIDMSNDRVRLFNNEERSSVKITDIIIDGEPAGTKVKLLLKIQ